MIAVNWPLVLSICSPILSFFGAISGTAFALRRHRSERAFDRRAEWHERAFVTLSAMASLNREFANEIRYPTKAGNLLEISQRMASLGREQRHHLDESALYASTQLDIAIRRAALTQLAFLPRGQQVTRENSFAVARDAVRELEAAMQCLADEYREHMALRPRDHEAIRQLDLSADAVATRSS